MNIFILLWPCYVLSSNQKYVWAANIHFSLFPTKKNFNEDKLREEIRKLYDEKNVYQDVAKESLRKVLTEKMETLKKLQQTERFVGYSGRCIICIAIKKKIFIKQLNLSLPLLQVAKQRRRRTWQHEGDEWQAQSAGTRTCR